MAEQLDSVLAVSRGEAGHTLDTMAVQPKDTVMNSLSLQRSSVNLACMLTDCRGKKENLEKNHIDATSEPHLRSEMEVWLCSRIVLIYS